jgi:glutamine cyclotransferase
MKKVYFAGLLLMVVLVVGVVLLVLFSQVQPSTSAQHYTYNVVKFYPHDTNAFTEGLVFENNSLYEGTGLYGSSDLRRVDFETGNVLQDFRLSGEYFGEGITVVNDSIIQLTWQNNTGFVYDKETFNLRRQFSFSTDGWGLTFDGKNLIMSDGSANLYFLDPVTFQVVRQVSVHDGNASVTLLNELEYIKGDVYANVWLAGKIAIINPQTGQVKAWINLDGIESTQTYQANGIAYDTKNDRLFITGKNWPNLYEIKLTPEK